MVNGKKQNANVSLHSVLWLCCPSIVFVGVHRVHGDVVSAITRFNEGTAYIYEKLAIERNVIMNIYIETMNRYIRIPLPVIKQ